MNMASTPFACSCKVDRCVPNILFKFFTQPPNPNAIDKEIEP